MAAHPDPGPSANLEASPAPQPQRDAVREQKAEAELFSYITRGRDIDEPEPSGGPRFHLGKRALVFAMLLAAAAIVAAPQAPWHPAARRLWTHGALSLHAWLNPQVVAPAQAPESHESFGRAGDEYKLPVAENIPDATTDPSQIRVVPVVDPTAKKPASNGADQNETENAADSTQATDAETTGAQPTASQPAPAASTPAGSPQPVTPSNSTPVPSPATPATLPTNPIVPVPTNSATFRPPQTSNPSGQAATIPSSLKSQMASTVPDASGNKAPETALPSIEPVTVSESTERALLSAQPSIAYPDNAKGQQGTVILQLLIGRDGSVQDAKFLQGSLVFARAATNGVQSWKFKPYLMNGRAVSVQTQLTLSFNPAK
jgi:periplasmic protein TonB